ncbi:unnamed protein product, partial [Adineta steineri]
TTSATPQIIETIQSPGFQTAQPQIRKIWKC